MRLQRMPWLALLLAALPQAALACGFTGNLTSYAVSGSLRDDLALPAPEVASVNVTRGLAGGGKCDRLGLLSVALQWPRGTGFSLDEIGFEYRLVQGEAPEGLVPEAPVVARSNQRGSEHVLTWPDEVQAPLQLLLEVRAVTADGRRGQPAQVRVEARPGG